MQALRAGLASHESRAGKTSRCVKLSWGPSDPGHGKNVVTSFTVQVWCVWMMWNRPGMRYPGVEAWVKRRCPTESGFHKYILYLTILYIFGESRYHLGLMTRTVWSLLLIYLLQGRYVFGRGIRIMIVCQDMVGGL